MEHEKYEQEALAALQAAQQAAALRYHQEISTRHLIWALLQAEDGRIATLVKHAGVDAVKLQEASAQLLSRQPAVRGQESRLYYAPALLRVLAIAETEGAK